MKSMLPNKDELIIRYVMDELDPSEKMLVESAMAEDENILIEVEALRSTFKRCVENMPGVSAPPDVLDTVVSKAQEFSAANRKQAPVRYLVFRRISYAAAATVLLSAGFSWYASTGTSDVLNQTETVELMASPTEVQPAANTPWIDHQNILHINTAGFGSVATTPDSTPTRLRPIEEVTAGNRPARQLHLTGTQ
ncbi:MAG: hypothetical protein JJU41_06030 [Bacteroidetes bacterium]|nr:hypothetical protein [Bacteroidota bacterium]